MPGRLVFSTTADGASSPTERMRIDSAGNVGIGTSNPGGILEISSPEIAGISSSWRCRETNLLSTKIQKGNLALCFRRKTSPSPF
jgi:hypothetical protein